MQQAIVEAAMRGEPVLGILPTGTGKSVCYQIPALSRYEKTGALTVVISPLVALMADQVAGLQARGISSCAAVNGLLSMPERADVLDRVRLGDIAILLIAPEQLRSRTVRRALEQREIGAAHDREEIQGLSRICIRIVQPGRPRILVVAGERRAILCERQAQPPGPDELGISEVLQHLDHRPLAVCLRPAKGRGSNACDRVLQPVGCASQHRHGILIADQAGPVSVTHAADTISYIQVVPENSSAVLVITIGAESPVSLPAGVGFTMDSGHPAMKFTNAINIACSTGKAAVFVRAR